MGDLATVVMAAAAAAGAWAAQPLPLWWGGVAVALGLLLRRPVLLCLGVALAASALSARSWAGLVPPTPHRFSGMATLVGDPSPMPGGLRVLARLDGRRVEAWARGPEARRLAPRLSGEQVELEGQVAPLPENIRSLLAQRHVAARLLVSRVGRWAPGDHVSRVANGIRRTLLAGAASMPPDRRALFAGFVFGDDRDQPPEVVSDFRASGLAHLLAVSGQNVAFVLALFLPVLRRLGLRTRVLAGVGVLVLFGTLTRWEPSVVRASAMAMIALLATGLGRPVSRLRVLALAVTGALLVDPLLVGSVGFLLSVGACAGIALLAAPFTDALPGPRPLASALGVTLAAQVGVAPVLVPVFGGLPVAAIPANLLAVPAAGPLTLWGMAAGLPAGVVGAPLAGLLHVPTDLLVRWVATVARYAAAAPLGRLGLLQTGVVAAVLVLAARARARNSGVGLCVCLAGGLVVLGAAALPALRPGTADDLAVTQGVRLWRQAGATVLVVDDARSPDRLLEALRTAWVSRLDVLVTTRPGVAAASVVEPLLARFPPRLLLAPPGNRLAQAVVPRPGSEVVVGGLAVRFASVAPRLIVEVVKRAGGDGAPPAPR